MRVMLELRPTCEQCNAPLPPSSKEAMICSFECTFCRTCAESVLAGVCPNCGGNFVPRPIRPARSWNGNNDLARYPASTTVRHRPASAADHAALVSRVQGIPPEQR